MTWHLPMKVHLDECHTLAKEHIKNDGFLNRLYAFFNNQPTDSDIVYGTPFSTLNRAHAFLFSFTAIEFDINVEKKLVDAWNPLMIFFLIKDDLSDIREDLKNNHDNVLIEAGLGIETAYVIEKLLDKSFVVLHEINQVMSNRVDHMRKVVDIPKMVKAVVDENFNKVK